jgi:hypothetical protein
MAAKSHTLNPKQEAAALLLAVGRSVKAAARDAGVAERTLRNWRCVSAFRARVQELRSDVFGRAVGALCGISVRAARTLAGLLQSTDEKVQLGAAKAVLEAAPRMREQIDLVEQLEELKRQMEEVRRHGLGGTEARNGTAGGGVEDHDRGGGAAPAGTEGGGDPLP